MLYKIVFHKSVWKEDFHSISDSDQKRILKTISRKLILYPDRYGKPLSGKLYKFFALKVGEFRVVYQIRKQEIQVWIVRVGFRRDMEVYLQAVKRILKD